MEKAVLELIKRWGGRESSKIEYKLCKSSLSKDLWETISAFSNEGGGLILLGYERVGDKYVPVGVENPPKMLDDFTSTVGEKFNFCPMVKAEIITDKGKQVIAIEVKEAPRFQKPVYLKDAGPIKGGFKRLGATNLRLTDSDVQKYYQERMGSPDAQPLCDATIKDIDPRTVSAFRNLRKLVKPEAPELALDEKHTTWWPGTVKH
ncbi:MAG: ATP-binding protein [Candidatus Hadarchaeales archaeon]